MNKLIIAALIGLLIFTACDENTKNADNETVLPTATKSEDNIINLSEINISSIKIKDLNTGQDSILIKDGIVREFCEFLKGMKFTKTDEPWSLKYVAEIFDGGESVLKISFTGRTLVFSEKVIIGNNVIEKGNYKLENWISQNIRYFYEGKVLDPLHIEASANIFLPEADFKIDIVDKGNAKVNQQEVYSKLYEFVTESFCSRNFEIMEYKRIDDYELMEQQKQIALNNSRAVTIEKSGNYIRVDSACGYDEAISASSIILSECLEKPGIYQLYADKTIIDIKADSEFVRGFEDVFNTNADVIKDLTPDEIEVLFNKKEAYYVDYICKNLGIESWYGNEPTSLEKSKMSLDNQREPYTVLEVYNGFSLQLLFFKKNKFIDYIDFGGGAAGTEYRLEKAGDKVFVVGKNCRGYGTGIARYFEHWYTLNDQGKKLVVSFPYRVSDYTISFAGYNLNANSIKLSSKGDVNLTVDYSITKNYFVNIIGDLSEEIIVEDTNKVIFKWDDKKAAFLSEYATDDMGVTEIPSESKAIKDKCTNILKKKYQRFAEMVSAATQERDVNTRECLKRVWKYFLNDCEDCDEKAALLEILSKN